MKADKQSIKEILRQLYHLWTKAIDTPNYNKEEWVELERKINEITKSSEKSS